jgi:hypothetical protein
VIIANSDFLDGWLTKKLLRKRLKN